MTNLAGTRQRHRQLDIDSILQSLAGIQPETFIEPYRNAIEAIAARDLTRPL